MNRFESEPPLEAQSHDSEHIGSLTAEMSERMRKVTDLPDGPQLTRVNCFGAVDFITGREKAMRYKPATKEKGEVIELSDLLASDKPVPFGIQFVGANRRYEDSFDDVGFIVYEPLHEAIALKRTEDDFLIFEKCGGQGAQTDSSLATSLAHFQGMVEEGTVELRVFDLSDR